MTQVDPDNLNRDEVRYILDPKEVYGEDPSTSSGRCLPGETIRVLKDKDVKQLGDALRGMRRRVFEAGELAGNIVRQIRYAGRYKKPIVEATLYCNFV